MRALVTGGAGFIGSHIVDLLLQRGYEVRIYDSLEKPTHAHGAPPYLPRDAEFVHADVRDRESLTRALRGVDVVLHQAATGGFAQPLTSCFETNTVGTALLWDVIREERLPIQKVVVASSVAVYGEGLYRCSRHGSVHPRSREIAKLQCGDWEPRCPDCGHRLVPLPTSEDTPVEPPSTYAISKYDQERIVLSSGRQLGIPAVALRYFLTYGPRQSIHTPYTGVCSIFATRVRNGLPVVLYEDGQQTRDFVFVRDTARANVFVLEDARADYRVFNVATGTATPMSELAELLHDLLDAPARIERPQRFRPGDVRHLVADVTRLRDLGFCAEVTLKEGLAEYVQWVQTQNQVPDSFDRAEETLRQSGLVRSVS